MKDYVFQCRRLLLYCAPINTWFVVSSGMVIFASSTLLCLCTIVVSTLSYGRRLVQFTCFDSVVGLLTRWSSDSSPSPYRWASSARSRDAWVSCGCLRLTWWVWSFVFLILLCAPCAHSDPFLDGESVRCPPEPFWIVFTCAWLGS